MRHVPVLLNEVISSLQLKSGYNVIDCTLGDAGHSEAMLEQIKSTGKLLGIDADPESLLRSKQYLYKFGNQIQFVRDNFVNLKKIVDDNQFGSVKAILMDLGWSSPQFAERGRGFSFDGDEPLDMRFAGGQSTDLNKQLTASEVVNDYNVVDLARIFKMYGEEALAKEIAAYIVSERKERPIERTKELVEIILKVYRNKLKSTKEVPWIGGIHPATRVFQALRLEVNQELPVLRQGLAQAVDVLTKGGRLAVISFHSLEDRIVKHFFQAEDNKTIKIITKKPIIASEEEIKNNPRARSAKLRVVEKIKD